MLDRLPIVADSQLTPPPASPPACELSPPTPITVQQIVNFTENCLEATDPNTGEEVFLISYIKKLIKVAIIIASRYI